MDDMTFGDAVDKLYDDIHELGIPVERKPICIGAYHPDVLDYVDEAIREQNTDSNEE